jgi:hypothetical protein
VVRERPHTQRHGDEAICSCPVSCLIGDGCNSASHGVCRHIDDRGIDGDSISRGVGGLVDNPVYGDSVSGSVGSLERCIHTIECPGRGRHQRHEAST